MDDKSRKVGEKRNNEDGDRAGTATWTQFAHKYVAKWILYTWGGGGAKTSSHTKPLRTANCLRARPSTLKSSGCSGPNCANIMKLCWWLTCLQSLEQFSIYLSNWLETRLRGNRYPIAANFLRVKLSKLEFFCWSKPVSITTESIKLPARNTFKIGVLPWSPS